MTDWADTKAREIADGGLWMWRPESGGLYVNRTLLLDTITAALREARREGIEEAARMFDDVAGLSPTPHGIMVNEMQAAAIRALKDKPT